MDLNKIYCGIVFFILICFTISCNKGIPVIDGKYISHIKTNVITTEDGIDFELPVNNESKIYYLMRHAEKDTSKSEDPHLTPEGEKRAEKLYEILKGTRVDAIYSTMYMRTLLTVDPLAKGKGMTTFPYEPSKLKKLVTEINSDSTIQSVVIVGHSNTTPALANSLYGDNYFNNAFSDDAYEDLIVVLIQQDSTKQIIPLKYKY